MTEDQGDDMEVDAEWDYPFRDSLGHMWTEQFALGESLNVKCTKFDRLFGHIPSYYMIEIEWSRQDKHFTRGRCDRIVQQYPVALAAYSEKKLTLETRMFMGAF
jgi:hypothetical protein